MNSSFPHRIYSIAKMLTGIVVICIAGKYILVPRPPISTRYIFENTFRGICRIVISPSDGVEVPFVNGEYVFAMPTNGVLKIKSNPCTSWETPEYIYQSGVPITHVSSIADLPVKGVALVRYGTYNNGTEVIFIGSKKDADKIDWSVPHN